MELHVLDSQLRELDYPLPALAITMMFFFYFVFFSFSASSCVFLSPMRGRRA